MKQMLLFAAIAFSMMASAQVGINTTTPDASAALDVSGNNSGLLIPRVSLEDVLSDSSPIANPAVGLLVYNTNPSVFAGYGEGFYYWNGWIWTKFDNSAEEKWTRNPVIGTLFPSITTDRVGIGTSNPVGKLEVATPGLSEFRLSSTSAFGPARFSMISDRGFSSEWRPAFIEDADNGNFTGRLDFFTNGTGTANRFGEVRTMSLVNGRVGIGTTNPNSPLTFGQTIGNKINLFTGTNGNYGLGIDNYLLKIHTEASSSDIAFGYDTGGVLTERMRIRGNGNVGIGTPTPNAPLAFPSTIGHKITLFAGASGNYGFGIAGGLLKIQTDASAADIGFGYDVSGNLTERMRIKGTGNVGIGTSDPDTRLEVTSAGTSELRVSSTSAFGSARISMVSDRNLTNEWRPAYLEDADNGNFTGRLDFFTNGSGFANRNGSVRAMSIANGNVGIGNTTPAERLHVSGKVRIADGSQAAGRVLVSDANGTGTWQNNIAITPAQTGVFQGGVSFGNGLPSNTGSTGMTFTGAYIRLPPGKWMVFGTFLINAGIGINSQIFVRTTLSGSTGGTDGGDIIGGSLISGVLDGPGHFGIANGQWVVNNTSGGQKFYYVWASMEKFGSVGTNVAVNEYGGGWAENAMTAIPMN